MRIQFHPVPGVVPELADCAANELVVRLQPEETIYWKVQNKVRADTSTPVSVERASFVLPRRVPPTTKRRVLTSTRPP